MSISAVVHGELVADSEAEHDDRDDNVVFQQEFSTPDLIVLLTSLMDKMLNQGISAQFSVMTHDHLLALLEHGGDLEIDDALLCKEEVVEVEEHLSELKFNSDEDRGDLEAFIDELKELLEASEEADGSIEFFNFEDTVSGFDDDDDEEEEGEEAEAEAEVVVEAKEEEGLEADPALAGAGKLLDALLGGAFAGEDVEGLGPEEDFESEPDDDYFLEQDENE